MSRQHSWRADNPDAVIVARPSFWGNPFVLGTPENGGNITPEVAVAEFTKALIDGRLQIKLHQMEDLRGKDLACWCPTSQPCHADVLLELANAVKP